MRICFLGDAGSIHTFRFAKYFVEAGHKVKVISMRPARAEFGETDIEVYANRLVSDVFVLHALANIIKLPRVMYEIWRFKPDILHVHDVFCYGLYALLSRRSFIATPWGSDILIACRKVRVLSVVVERVMRQAQIILYDGGEHIRKRLLELGADEARMRTFRFGVDVSFFSPSKRSDVVRRSLGCLPYGHLVISTRNFYPVYDVETYLRAVPLVLQVMPDTRFVVVGDGVLRDELVLLAEHLGVMDQISFIGRVSADEMSVNVASSDVYVSTSTSDAGLAVSTAEAMACGIPVAVTDVGDNGDWVNDGKNGFLFPVGDASALAKHIVVLLKDSKLRGGLGENNVDEMHKRYNFAKSMGDVESIYCDLLSGNFDNTGDR